MLRIIGCLTQDHDPWLVLLAVVICLLGTFGTATLLNHLRHHGGHGSQRWLAACALSTGTAIWATHFIAMLAFQPTLAAAYDPWLTAGSLLIAVVVTGAGCALAARAGTAAWRAAGGGIIGLGIGSMHYAGMAAFHIAGHKLWHPDLVVASVVAGIGFGAAATLALAWRETARRIAVPLLLTLAIAGLHFTAMAGLEILPDPTVAVPQQALSGWMLAGLVAQGALLLLGLTGAGMALEQRESRRRDAESVRLQALADAAVEGLVVCHDGIVVAANASFRAMLGQSAAPPEGQRLSTMLADAATLCAGEAQATHETQLRLPDGGSRPVEVVCKPILFDGRACQVLAVRDLSARKQAEDHIAFLAHHDSLTGLPNRASFNETLDRELAVARRHARGTAVLAIDLDRFKTVNDSLGHAMGDALLVKVAERLRGMLRESDAAARIGGDEFAVIQPNEDQPKASARLATRIVEVLGRPFLVDGHILNIGASVGIAVAPSDAETADQLLKQADLAMYRAKAEGRGGFRMFKADMDAAMQERRVLELELRRAAARVEFELHYQPLLHIGDARVIGFEALLRWRHPERGLVPPDRFIPLAEETGLIGPIGEWVLRTACRDAAGWPVPYTVAVNLSPVQFRTGRLVETVEAALTEAGLPPSRLELEITESVLLTDSAESIAVLHRLRALGVRIAMDDFGTGYSSLSYLRSFPFDKIKIDRSFVRDMENAGESAAIVRAILGLGRNLGIATTAEGVETNAQLAAIRAEGCDQAQGYLVSKPLAPDAMAAFLAAEAPGKAA